MSKKSLVITIVGHQCFIRHLEGEDISKNELLFTAISETYLPLLNMFANLEADGVPFHANMVLSPTLCNMLADPVIQQQYIEWLDKIIALGEAEADRYEKNSVQYKYAIVNQEKAKQNKRDFQETLNQDILSKFAYYAKRGDLELLATAATYSFLPHYRDMPEAVQAQIEMGLHSHKSFFGIAPDGFWLPYLGYYPGIEAIIRSYGFNYTILETHGVLFGNPEPENGIFSPVRTRNSLAIFARDSDKYNTMMENPLYRNQEKDIGFESSTEYLSNFLGDIPTRVATGYKYWSKESEDSLYNKELALNEVKKDAKNFLDKKAEKLAKAAELKPNTDISLVCSFDALDFGSNWHEGVDWLEQVFRQAASRDDISITTCGKLVDNHFLFPKIEPFPSAMSGTGYGEDLLSNSNAWMLRYVRKACDRMIDLAARFSDDTGLKARSLNLAAKEILLAQAGDWPQFINDGNMPDYAEKRFKESISAFTTVFDSLGANSISTEWLTRMEKQHPVFPDINYHIFSQKR